MHISRLLANCALFLAVLSACSVPEAFPLSEPGPYFVGTTSLVLVDNSRNGRDVRVTLWYPALKQTSHAISDKLRA